MGHDLGGARRCGQVTHYVAAFSDITEHKKAEEQIQQLAFYDPLTRCPTAGCSTTGSNRPWRPAPATATGGVDVPRPGWLQGPQRPTVT
jgi:hypothetical protein